MADVCIYVHVECYVCHDSYVCTCHHVPVFKGYNIIVSHVNKKVQVSHIMKTTTTIRSYSYARERSCLLKSTLIILATYWSPTLLFKIIIIHTVSQSLMYVRTSGESEGGPALLKSLPKIIKIQSHQ